jgi:hypothetical protein
LSVWFAVYALMAVAGLRTRQGGMQQHTMMGEMVAPEAMQGTSAVYDPPERQPPVPEQTAPKALEPQAQPPQTVVPK